MRKVRACPFFFFFFFFFCELITEFFFLSLFSPILLFALFFCILCANTFIRACLVREGRHSKGTTVNRSFQPVIKFGENVQLFVSSCYDSPYTTLQGGIQTPTRQYFCGHEGRSESVRQQLRKNTHWSWKGYPI